jgi:hypothetical protein
VPLKNVGTRNKNPLGRVGAIGALVALLLAYTAAPVFGHHVVSIGCNEEGQIEVVANVFDGHKIIVTIDGNEVMNEAVPGPNANHTYDFDYDGGPAVVVVTLKNGDAVEASASQEVNCHEPEPNNPELSFSDCEEIGGDGGSITVSGLDENVFLQINGPTVLTITADGTYPLVPGHYGFRAVFDGQAIDSGTFDIGDCPEGQFNALAAPCPEIAGTISTPRIHFVGLLVLLHAWVDGAEAAPNGDGDVTVTPGLHTWEVRAGNNVTVLASGDVLVPTCTEGGTGGSTGTPAASLPNSAVSSTTAGAPIATIGFALLVLGSLGALAFVNGKSSRSR